MAGLRGSQEATPRPESTGSALRQPHRVSFPAGLGLGFLILKQQHLITSLAELPEDSGQGLGGGRLRRGTGQGTHR